ncbi:MAG: gliding motility-associated protein GldE [Muribaculaceae bacterium]|nr:gliding motility-associated protein GldE [Muribaculaceae bacterium]
MDWPAWFVIVIIALFCLLISAFVSGSEMAYFSLNQTQIADLEEDEHPEARRAFRLLSNSERLLATILISNNLVNITMVVMLTFAINQVATFNSDVINFLIQTVFLTFLLLLFGEIFPKLVARGRTMQWVLKTSQYVTLLYNLCGPLARLMVRSTRVMNRIVTKKDTDISTDDLETALEISDLKEGQEKEMLEGILTFGEKEVSDVMISRVDVTALEYHADWEEAMHMVIDSGYSRIPVYDTSQDTISGILYAKDLLPYIGKRDNSFRWQTLIRPAFFVPESMMIDDLLEQFRIKRIHIAIVVDEYGGTSGIVTLEDVIEEIVGEIDDEYDDKSSQYRRVAPDTYIFEAKISMTDFCRILDIEEDELGDHEQAETLAGLVLSVKGDFPTPREVLKCGPLTLQVLKMERHRILKVKVTVNPAETSTPGNTPPSDNNKS